MFNGEVVCVISGFAGFTRLSAEVICRNIVREEGKVVGVDEIEGNQVTCIIVPNESKLGKILQVLKIGQLPGCNIVVPNWAIDSVKRKKKLPFAGYHWVESIAEVDDGGKKDQQETIDVELPLKREAESESPEEINKKVMGPASEIVRKEPKPSAIDEETLQLRKELLNNRDRFNFAKKRINLNEHITSVLEVLMSNYTILKDKGRSFAYRFAIISLQSFPEKITNLDQVEKLHKVGGKIKKKIGEILETGTLRRVKAMDELGRLKSIKEFSGIWGIGSATADKLYSLGYRSIADLRANVPSCLNDNQRIGLELYEDFNVRIPREEVKKISEIVVAHAKALLPSVEITANTCGSYRRGLETCGDVDVLLTFDNVEAHKSYLQDLISNLREAKLITHTLVLSEFSKKHDSFTFEGVAKLPEGLHRRLDIKVYPKKFYAWALMHFTGSANFNRSIRLFAKTKGLKLTDEGIFPAIRKNGETHCGASLAECYTEEDIFKLFDMPYKPPEQRDL